MNITTPEWVKDAVFYQIFPDRFAKSSRLSKDDLHLEAWDALPTNYGFKGGDLLGVAEHLEYLKDLGINALYLNPIFASAANHRYHTYDYYAVDPLLGGNSAFKNSSTLPISRTCGSSWMASSIMPAADSGNSTTSWRMAPAHRTWTGSTLTATG